MWFHFTLLMTVWISAVLAQKASATAVAAMETSMPVDSRIKQVIVGGFQPAATPGGQPIPVMAFTPETVTAEIGDTIRFTFLGNNHSVMQTSMEAPCQAVANGFNSGLQPNPNNDLATAPTVDLEVKGPETLYMSTLSTESCGAGMVLTINPPLESQPGNHTAFKAAAISAGNPGGRVAAIVAATPASQVGSTISVQVGGTASQTSAAAAVAQSGIVVQGTGRTNNGQPCGCSCLCGGSASPPSGVAAGNFGGVVGQMPAAGIAAEAVAPTSIGAMRAAFVSGHDERRLH
ncbi:uncharacterized protein PV09_03781 [Verruconis gallopava]|uniref:Phytocyanin domain-containing protein n=1 Tax=Verruconis gallopava TaxID=253628 RepID=A0A0D2AFI4_9PEZI|nr:uncharacterized protein PV09_03781 [Verruconis gallopava]KIW05245.1 hypothetical protein PV09_03781 [Verruconis gallopava]